MNQQAAEARGRSDQLGDHAATVTFGREGMIHGFRSLLLQDDEGNAASVHSIASGLDHPVVGPEPAFLNDVGRLRFETATDEETLHAFYTLSRLEGIIPALESAHAVAYAMKFAKGRRGETILVNLSGRGDKDIDYIAENFGYGDD